MGTRWGLVENAQCKSREFRRVYSRVGSSKRVAQEQATGGRGKSSLFTSPSLSQSNELNAGDDPNWDWSAMQPAPQWPLRAPTPAKILLQGTDGYLHVIPYHLAPEF